MEFILCFCRSITWFWAFWLQSYSESQQKPADESVFLAASGSFCTFIKEVLVSDYQSYQEKVLFILNSFIEHASLPCAMQG